MTATTVERNTDFAGVVPCKGTAPVAANTLILRGAEVYSSSGTVSLDIDVCELVSKTLSR